MEERAIHLRAFHFWARISSGIRNKAIFQQVAHEVNMKSATTIYSWSKRFDWEGRFKELLAKAQEIEAHKTAGIILRTREDHRVMVGQLLDQMQNRIDRKLMSLGSSTDVEKLIKLDLQLSGDPVRTEKEVIIITAIPQPGDVISKRPDERFGTTLRMLRGLPEALNRSEVDMTEAGSVIARPVEPSLEKPKDGKVKREKHDMILFVDNK